MSYKSNDPNRKPVASTPVTDVYGTRKDAEAYAQEVSNTLDPDTTKVFKVVYVKDGHYRVSVESWLDTPLA